MLETASGQQVVCYAVTGDEGLAIIAARAGELVLAEMVPDMNVAVARAELVRATLIS
jgi:aspartate ammonia-lyase